MRFDFLNILALLMVFSGVVMLVDSLLRAWQRRSTGTPKEKNIKYPWVVDYARSFFPVLLIVLCIRAFVIQPYRVPTGSLEPTITPGDMILVNQYDYGLRIPLWNKKLFNVGEPKTGQIALFRWPVNRGVTFVKRVIGVPGDRISYINKVLYINGKAATQTFVRNTLEVRADGQSWQAKEYEENLNGVKHLIYIRPDRPVKNFKKLNRAKGSVFYDG